MTTITISVHRDSVFLDCVNHAGDYDVCTIISTLCRVLALQTEPTVYEPGHVKIIDDHASEETKAVFRAVERTMRDAAEAHPEHITIY